MDPVTLLLGVGAKLIDNLFPDPKQKAEAQLALFKLQQDGVLAHLASDTQLASKQAEINIEEAKSDSLFKSGWRPAVGWVCACTFAAKYIGGPLLFVVAQFWGMNIVLPDIDMVELMPVLIGMLGLGAYRTFEKTKK